MTDYPPPRPARRWALSPSTLTILFSLTVLALLPPTHAQCQRAARDKNEAPEFLCSFNITFTRQTDCSARITETLVFPHTTGDDEERVIQAIRNIQPVSEIKLTRDDRPVTISPKLDKDGTVIVSLPTVRTSNPTKFDLSYTIGNAVMRFTDGCGKGDPDPSENVMRFRTGELRKTVDLLTVNFATSAQSSLLIVGSSGTGSQKITITERDFENDPDFSVQEAGSSMCPVDQVCFSRAMPIWQIGLIGALIGVPVVLTVTCGVVFVVCELCGIRPDVKGDEPIDESEMVSFKSGQFKTCIPNDGDGGCECEKGREFFATE